MRVLMLLFCLALNTVGLAQEVVFEAPEGWREEIVSLPPDFAPNMTWKGREVLRFSPGMFQQEAPDFFSYVFLLELDEGLPDWNQQLLRYYEGLARAVQKNPKLDTSGYQVSLQGTPEALYGTLKWVEPFVTKKPQTLYLELHQVGELEWFVCASPQKTDRPIWTQMRRIRGSL